MSRRQHGLRAVVDGLRGAIAVVLRFLAVFIMIATIGVGLVGGLSSALVMLLVAAVVLFLSGRIAP